MELDLGQVMSNPIMSNPIQSNPSGVGGVLTYQTLKIFAGVVFKCTFWSPDPRQRKNTFLNAYYRRTVVDPF